jgi:hypothetical protein
VWQALYAELKDKGFMVVAVAEESRGAEHARPWIEQAKSGYWQLIDTEHRLSDLYNLVNVPQAVWIDEQGSIVRPPETAGSTDISPHGFKTRTPRTVRSGWPPARPSRRRAPATTGTPRRCRARRPAQGDVRDRRGTRAVSPRRLAA